MIPFNPDCLIQSCWISYSYSYPEEKDGLRQLNQMRHLLFTELCQRLYCWYIWFTSSGKRYWLNRKNETSTSLSPIVLPTNSENPSRGYWFSPTCTRNCCLYSGSSYFSSCADFASLTRDLAWDQKARYSLKRGTRIFHCRVTFRAG